MPADRLKKPQCMKSDIGQLPERCDVPAALHMAISPHASQAALHGRARCGGRPEQRGTKKLFRAPGIGHAAQSTLPAAHETVAWPITGITRKARVMYDGNCPGNNL
jgi:hypothetical protein